MSGVGQAYTAEYLPVGIEAASLRVADGVDIKAQRDDPKVAYRAQD
jgi:metal-dependent HD superfamily phosphatase/phosphodiesterase